MREQKYRKLKFNEIDVLADLLLRVSEPAHENLLDDQVQLFKETVEMDEPRQLQRIDTLILLQRDQSWQCGRAVDPKEPLHVLNSHLLHVCLFLSLIEFEEVQQYVNGEADVGEEFEDDDVVGSILEDEDEGRGEHGVDGQGVD